jgi:hypothetical protein
MTVPPTNGFQRQAVDCRAGNYCVEVRRNAGSKSLVPSYDGNSGVGNFP